ncbi:MULTISPECIES: nitroreductase family deazaflavin-dependent oxidoreductase [Micromonospora]|uniref:Nitroreductase family deazaflavin-dependent oxidoreductase n=1 Tax=Micromonospora antibiotica TaxID=2807623 RepID=A0ABS3VEI1_9ACTN|nr:MULTISPECIES: nitroreductase family deazaflavin-dependent oxidoreductase [Micromonospora]MBO4164046.1 nitroreductase family deazaflavin-dependent oxidoreductase [Micromonospora antibiotica]MBW4705094.1 nitroreductase family deazaflavin-dependent oxidoreductase [Micromonospora sp. RL09-050-HVF-A]
MSTDEQVLDSPEGWVADHIRRYVATGGAEGHEWQPGVYTLLLTTRGRRSGRLRRTALIYGRDGDDYLIVASQGGAPQHPSWYLNLLDEPDAQVQVGPETFAVRARTAEPAERARMWPRMTGIWPAYNEYQSKTDREIPVVVLQRR